MQRFEQQSGDSLKFAGRGRIGLLRPALALGIANNLIKANRHSLSQIHRDIFIARRNANKPVAVAEGVIRESKFFRTEE